MKKIFLLSLLILIVCISTSTFSQIPSTISYQGFLSDNAGNPKPDGDYSITFSFYESNAGGDPIWNETKTVSVKKGLFNTQLGDATPFGEAVKFDKQYYLGIKVGDEPELTPLIPLSSVAYSLSSQTAEFTKNAVTSINQLKDNITLQGGGGTTVNADGNVITISSSGSGGGSGIQGLQNTDNAFSISNPTGPTATINLHNPFMINCDVGIGLDHSPQSKLDVNGGSGNGAKIGIHGSSNDNYGIYGTSNTNFGVFGESETSFGVLARTHNGKSYGLLSEDGNYGKNYCGLSSDNYAIFANGPVALSTVGIGAEPSQDPAGTKLNVKNKIGIGIYSEVINGRGIWGVAYNTDGGVGVVGENYATTGTTKGVWGVAHSPDGVGVVGENFDPNGWAGYFFGKVAVKTLQINGGSDLAEPFAVSGNKVIEAGTVMSIDEKNPGKLIVSSKEYDNKVAGIVSGAGGIKPGITLHQDRVLDGSTLIAISGRVYCKAEAFSGSINVGDLLTTSPIPGYAMKATDKEKRQGAVIGKAMSQLKNSKGLVLVLVNLQ